MRGVSRGRRGQVMSTKRGGGGAASEKGRSASKGARGRSSSRGARGRGASRGERGDVAAKGTRGRGASKVERGDVASKGTRGRGASKGTRGRSASRGARRGVASRGGRGGGRGSRGAGGRGRGRGKNQRTSEPDDSLVAKDPDADATKLALLSVSKIANKPDSSKELNAGNVKELREMIMPCVLGTVYEQEPAKTCPPCGEKLMWYDLSKYEEMLACPNPKCNYPFDEQHAYEIREKKKDDGKALFPPDADNQLLLDEFNCGMMNSNTTQDINNGINEPMPVGFQTTLQEKRHKFLHTRQKILNADPLVDISAAEATLSFPSFNFHQ